MAKIKISSESTIDSEEPEALHETFIMHNPTLEPPPKLKDLKSTIKDQFATGIISISIVGANHPITSIEYFTGKIEDIFNDFQCFVDRMLNHVTEEPSQNSEVISEAQSAQSVKIKTPDPVKIWLKMNKEQTLPISNGKKDVLFKPPQTSGVKVFKDKKIKKKTSVGRVSSDSVSSGVSRPESEGIVSTSSSKRNSDIRSSISSAISSTSELSRVYIGEKALNVEGQFKEKEFHQEFNLSMVPEEDIKEEVTKAEVDKIEDEMDVEDLRVYALFPNHSYFYPGNKSSSETIDSVIFGNSQKVTVKPLDVYDETFLPAGSEVEVSFDHGVSYEKGFYVRRICEEMAVPVEEMGDEDEREAGYEVSIGDDIYEIYRHQTRVREDIMRLIMGRERAADAKEQGTSLANICIGNILDGKRNRKPKRNSIYIVESPLKRCGSPSIFALQKSKRIRKMCATPTSKKREVEHSLLFQGKYFLITSAVDGEDGETMRTELIQRIVMNGGIIVEYPKFSLVNRENFISNILLVVIGSIREIWKRRTMKYLYALVLNNTPIINPFWVFDSIKNRRIMDLSCYLYDRGIHPITNEIVPGNITQQSDNSNIAAFFDNLKVWIIDYEDTEFPSQWEHIIELAGGKCQMLQLGYFSPNLDQSTCHMVLGERDGVTRRLLDRLSSLDIPIVTAEYFMDSLISNQVLDLKNYKIDTL